MVKISDEKRCGNCGNKSYIKCEGQLKIYTYSCKCGNVFSKIETDNLKLARMISEDANTFHKLTVLDLVQILEEHAFKEERYVDTFLYAQELALFKKKLSTLPIACRLILDFCRKIQDENRIVNRLEIIDYFSKNQNLKPEEVENFIEKLLEIGGLFIPRDGFLACTYSFVDKTNEK